MQLNRGRATREIVPFMTFLLSSFNPTHLSLFIRSGGCIFGRAIPDLADQPIFTDFHNIMIGVGDERANKQAKGYKSAEGLNSVPIEILVST